MAVIIDPPLLSDLQLIRDASLQAARVQVAEAKLRMVVRKSKVIVSVGHKRAVVIRTKIANLCMIKTRRVLERSPLARTLEMTSLLRDPEAAVAVGTQKINAMLLQAGQRLDSSTEAPRVLHPVVRKGVNPVRCG